MLKSHINKKTNICSSKIVEELTSRKYFQQPISVSPLLLAQQLLQNLSKHQMESVFSSESTCGKQFVRVEIPSYISLEIGKNNKVLVTGIRGSLIHCFDLDLSLEKKGQSLFISSLNETRVTTFCTQVGILYRMLVGVTREYKEKIKTSGVGYRGVLEESQLLTLFLGYSHRAHHRLPATVKAKFSRKNNKINLSGPSWPAVSASAAEIHHLKKPDVYNGKGVRYRGLKLRKKEGKKQSR